MVFLGRQQATQKRRWEISTQLALAQSTKNGCVFCIALLPTRYYTLSGDAVADSRLVSAEARQRATQTFWILENFHLGSLGVYRAGAQGLAGWPGGAQRYRFPIFICSKLLTPRHPEKKTEEATSDIFYSVACSVVMSFRWIP